MIIVFGEILFDLVEGQKRLGGAPFNFAFHLKKMGYPVRFVSRVGNDASGNEIIDFLNLNDFNIEDIQIDNEHPTGSVVVDLDESGSPSFLIKPDVSYDYLNFIPEKHMPLVEKAELIYFGTLMQRTEQGYRFTQQFIEPREKESTCFYDINLRPGCYTIREIHTSLKHADVLKLNRKELHDLKRLENFSGVDDNFVTYLMNQYTLNIIIVTKGTFGSKIYFEDGILSQKPHPVSSMADAVGAGDAYAAMLAVGILKEWHPERIISKASLFASRICEIQGAIPESEFFYEPFRKMLAGEE